MTLNDRVAWELGRALVRALTAEAQRDEAVAALAAQKPEPATPVRKRKT